MSNGRFTYADSLAEGESNKHFEIINGEVFTEPSPPPVHQMVSGELSRQLGNFLVGKQCRAFASPLDVRLFEKDGDKPENVDTVVQPDILVICDKSKIDKHGCKGAPNLVIEILSPSTYQRDCLIKFNLYLRAKVPEFWIIDPEEKTVRVCLLGSDGLYDVSKAYKPNDIVKVNVLEGCFIELSKVFADIE